MAARLKTAAARLYSEDNSEVRMPVCISQELEAAKAAADEQQRSHSADAEARQQLQKTLDERAAALDAAQQVPFAYACAGRLRWQPVHMSYAPPIFWHGQ